jgi:hypothetical protein
MTGLPSTGETTFMSRQDNSKAAPGRKIYKKPTLTTYGRLKDLTTGGSGTANEGSSGKKPRP